MCWLWPLVGTLIGALLGYLLGGASSRNKVDSLIKDNATLTTKVSELAGRVNSLSHYKEKVEDVKSVVDELGK